MGVRYFDAKRLEFIELRKGDKSMVEYEVKFLRLSQYAPGIVVEEQDKCSI